MTEPITMVKGTSISGSDDSWMGVTFQDARQVEREAKYVFYWPGTSKTLLLGRKVPTRGDEERAFLGLLQRWYRQDDEARVLWGRVKRQDPTLGRTVFGWDGLTDPQAGKVVAVGMMKVLEDRN